MLLNTVMPNRLDEGVTEVKSVMRSTSNMDNKDSDITKVRTTSRDNDKGIWA